MSKELTIYDMTHVHASGFRVVGCNGCHADRFSRKKHFTDAELAAEYWECQYSDEVMSNWGTIPARMRETRERLATMRRFATRPHALEEA